MNGGLNCKAIKDEPVTAHNQVILMTAYHKQPIALVYFGYDANFPKPLDNKTLIEILEKIFSIDDH